MKHKMMIQLDTDAPQPVVIILHAKGFKDPTTKAEAEDMFSKDINTLSTAMITAIREGGKAGVINTYKTLEQTIEYMKKNLSTIEITQEMPDELKDIIKTGIKVV